LARPAACAITSIDPGKASSRELESHLGDVSECLAEVWTPPLAASGYELPRPPVTVYSKPITTGCGQIDNVNASYCSADQRIYFSQRLPSALAGDVDAGGFPMEMVVAHEFGHAVQARSGILASGYALEDKAEGEAKKQLVSRRVEMQADCFAGLFLGAVAEPSGITDENVQAISEFVYTLGDDVLSGLEDTSEEHGTGQNRFSWFVDGQRSSSISACNTFTAPESQVR
jgi:predicted metalloprotease